MTRWLALPPLMLVMAACPADPAVRKSDAWNQAAGYGSYATQARYDVKEYRFAAAKMSLTTCAITHETYATEIRTIIERMVAGADAVDATIVAHDGAAYADAACVAAAIQAELAAHAAIACTLTTLDDDIAEAIRHADALTAYVEHAQARAAEVTTGLDTGDFTWSAPNACP